MIFSSLFKKKPNWQHQDSTLRITAINNELQLDDDAHLDILVTMISSDDSDLVRRAALIKLHDFEVFVQASNNNSSDKVRSFAVKQIENILVGLHAITLTVAQKQKFLSTGNTSLPLLEHCISHEQDSDMIIALFELINSRKTTHGNAHKKSNNHQLLINTFTQKQDELVQLYLLEKVTEAKLFEKLIKKSCNDNVSTLIKNRLTEIHQIEQKPAVLTKQAQLILSKLLALKDNLEYDIYQKKKLLLDEEWQAIQGDFSYLTIEQQQLFNLKYDNLNEQLTKTFASKVEAFEQQKIIDKLKYDKQQAKVRFSEALHEQNQQLTTAVFENTQLDEQKFNIVLSTLSDNVKMSVLNEEEQSVLNEQIKQLTTKLGQLGDIAESVSQATALISSVSQLSLPENLTQLNERSQVYNQWLVEWRTIEKKTNGMLPKSIKTAQQEITSLWQSGLKTLQSEQKNTFFQQKKKLNDIKRLIEQGKFKVCFGLFSGIKENFPLLSASQQQQLQRDFDNVSEKLAELSDWEHYIATPRKKELLNEIQSLITSPLDNPNEQASKVKQYRQTWNSLGHADDEVDQQLNDQFNQACEDAFAPCRLFYAEQDKLRTLHLATRETIITEAKQLLSTLSEMEANQSVDFKELDGQLNKLQRQWQNAGEVDRQHYKKLQATFRESVQPVKAAISNFHQSNVVSKKTLIAQAEALKECDDIYQAIDKIKQLQQEWREIGFAGNHQEAKLWKKFRSTNDEIFDKRRQIQNDQQVEQSKQEIEFTAQLTALQQELTSEGNSDVDNGKRIQSLQKASQALFTEVISYKPVIKTVATQVENFIKQLENAFATLEDERKKQSWTTLFSLLSLMANENVSAEQLTETEQYLALSKSWQKRVTEQVALTEGPLNNLREDETIVLEILAQVASPEEFAKQRLTIQVQMLQSKMVSGNTDKLNNDELTKALVDWLMLGKLSHSELPLLERAQAIYCK